MLSESRLCFSKALCEKLLVETIGGNGNAAQVFALKKTEKKYETTLKQTVNKTKTFNQKIQWSFPTSKCHFPCRVLLAVSLCYLVKFQSQICPCSFFPRCTCVSSDIWPGDFPLKAF